LNASADAIAFTLPAPHTFNRRLLIDSASPDAPERTLEGDDVIEVRGHAAVLLAADLSPADAQS
jgi:hypothetical protein